MGRGGRDRVARCREGPGKHPAPLLLSRLLVPELFRDACGQGPRRKTRLSPSDMTIGPERPFAYARAVLYEPAQFEPLIDEPWDPERVEVAIDAIVSDADAAFDLDALGLLPVQTPDLSRPQRLSIEATRGRFQAEFARAEATHESSVRP